MKRRPRKKYIIESAEMPANLLDWPFWNKVHTSIPSPINGRAKKAQGERWHLYQLHSVAFADIINRLAAECATRVNAHVTVEATSSWIDAHPHAHWQDSGSTTWRSVELADLLLVVNQKKIGQPATTSRAMLLQGKWTDAADELGRGTLPIGKKSSSIKERDLLELVTSPIQLHETRGKTSANAIPNALGNTFSLSVGGKSMIGMNYARYLLFPNTQSSTIDPYQTLIPAGRQTTAGTIEHYEDLLIEMASPKVTSIPNLANCSSDWKNLVAALTSWTSKRSVHRFKTKYSSQNDHVVTGLAFLAQHNTPFCNFLNAGGLNASYAAISNSASPWNFRSHFFFNHLFRRISRHPSLAAEYAKRRPNLFDFLTDEIRTVATLNAGRTSSPSDMGKHLSAAKAPNKQRTKKFLVVEIGVSYEDPIIQPERTNA